MEVRTSYWILHRARWSCTSAKVKLSVTALIRRANKLYILENVKWNVRMITFSLGVEEVSTKNWNILNLMTCFVHVLWYVIVVLWILIIYCFRVVIFCVSSVFRKRGLEEKQWQNCYFASLYKSLEVTLPYLS